MDNDPFFELYSAVDERSAAESVVRNYLPAFGNFKSRHMSPQLIDRTVMPKDTAKLSVHLPIVKDVK